MTVFLGVDAVTRFSLLTRDFHRLSTRDVDEMVRDATAIERRPVRRRR